MAKKQQNVPVEATSEQLGPCLLKVSVKVPAARVSQEFDHAIQAAGRDVNVPGYRPGKVPVEMLRKMLDDGIEQEASQHLFEHVIGEVIAEQKIEMLRLVDFDHTKFDVSEGQELEFDFEVETAPEINIPDWSKVEVDIQGTEANEEQINGTLEAIGRDHPRFDDSDLEKLDANTLAACDIAFSKDGEDGPTAKDLKLALGSPLYGTEEAAYEAAMTDAKVGSEFSLEVEFKEGFEKTEWVGEKGEVKVSVKKLVTPRPGSVEEIAADLNIEASDDVSCEDKFLEMVKGRLEMENKAHEMRRQVEAALENILAMAPFELPASIVQDEAEHAEKGAIEKLQGEGKSEDEAKAEIESQRSDIHADAERRLRNYFLIRRIAATEKVRVSNNDMDQAYREIGSRNGTDLKTTRAFYQERGLENQLRGDVLENKTRAQISRILASRETAAIEEVESAPVSE